MDTFIAAINYLFRTNIKDIKMKNNVKQVRSALWVLGVSECFVLQYRLMPFALRISELIHLLLWRQTWFRQ